MTVCGPRKKRLPGGAAVVEMLRPWVERAHGQHSTRSGRARCSGSWPENDVVRSREVGNVAQLYLALAALQQAREEAWTAKKQDAATVGKTTRDALRQMAQLLAFPKATTAHGTFQCEHRMRRL